MTGGTWRLSAAAQATGTLTPTGAVKGASLVVPYGLTQELSYGTGSGQADLFVLTKRTINATTAATYDLYTGTDLKDIFDDTAAGRKVKSLAVWVHSGGDSSGVLVGGGSQPVPLLADSSDKAKIFPSGPPFLAGSPAGIAVGATTNNLRVENLGAVAVVVAIALAMTSA